jgi:hypothetical protein
MRERKPDRPAHLKPHSTRLGALSAITGTCSHQFPFEFSQATEDGEH